MVTVLGQAAGWQGMVGGQVADLEAQDTEPDFDRVRAIHLGKTAALIEASLRLGALAGGGSTADVERLGTLGRELGLAFQIIDDVLDEMSSSEQLGKDAGADADNGKLTWPAVRGMDQAREDARLMVETALPLAREGLAGDLLEALAMKILNRSH
jgi:geranylgeranyl diphosphate synthase type II